MCVCVFGYFTTLDSTYKVLMTIVYPQVKPFVVVVPNTKGPFPLSHHPLARCIFYHQPNQIILGTLVEAKEDLGSFCCYIYSFIFMVFDFVWW